MLLRWISVVCVRKVESLLINFFFIVRLQENYGAHFFSCLGCLGYASKGERYVGVLEGTIVTT
jgi:hypothetical protein